MRWSELPLRTRMLGVAVLATGCVVASVAAGFDPDEPLEVVVGSPPGVAPTDRLDVERRGRSATSLPEAPRELWRRELAGGLDVSPVVAGDGGLIAALTSPDLVRLDGEGRQLWRVHLGTAAAVVPPTLAPDGSTVVLTGEGILWAISAGGAVRWRRDLRLRAKKALAAPLPLENGSVVVAGEQELVLVGATGEVQARESLPGRPIGGPIPWAGGAIVTSADGSVHLWAPPAAPRKIGDFGGQLVDGGATLASERALLAVVDRRRVVALDLKGRSVTPLLSVDGSTQLEGPLTLDQRGTLWVTGVAGELFGLDPHGMIVRRGALEPVAIIGDGGVPAIFQRIETRVSPPLIADPQGRLGFARASGKVGVVSSEGAVVVADARFCARPLAVLPGGPSRLLLACRSGSIGAFGPAP
jgi:hypothetical protein